MRWRLHAASLSLNIEWESEQTDGFVVKIGTNVQVQDEV
jgi:hypothetical protein